MKRAYTQFNPLLKKMMKRDNMSSDEVIRWFDSFPWDDLRRRHKEGIVGDHSISRMAMLMEREIIEKRCTHVFLPGIDFCNWIVSCVRLAQPEHCLVFRECFGDKPTVLNFPTSSHQQSVAVGVLPKTDIRINGEILVDQTALLISPSSERLINGPVIGDVDAWLCGIERDKLIADVGYGPWVTKLILGIGMYCHCFPETIKDGAPFDLKHPSHHQYNNSKTLGISESVCLGGTHDSPIAHFRRGHFRVLRSDKFKNKRFQSVFVRETFVNGKAKTVLSPEEVAA